MDRLVLSDAQWAKMEPLCLGKVGDPGRSGLRIKGRPGLIELIGDIESGRAEFGHVLGSVWIQDSHPGLVVIQAWDGPIRFD